MGKTTLLAFGLVVIATIQINAAPSPTAPVIAALGPPTKCVYKAPKDPLSGHTLAEYKQAAEDLKKWFEAGGKGLEPHGNGEQCLPILVKGAVDSALGVSLKGKDIHRNSYIEGYVPFANAFNNRGKGSGKGKQCSSNKGAFYFLGNRICYL